MEGKPHQRIGGEISTPEINQSQNNNYSAFPQHLIDNTDIEKLGFRWCMANNIPSDIDNEVVIINTDKSTGQGKHWRLFVVQYPYIFFFDPFSVYINDKLPKNQKDSSIGKPNKELINWGKKNGYKTIYCSEVDTQPIESNLCGYICLMLGEILRKQIGKLTEDKFDSIISRTFENIFTTGKEGENYNVKKVIAWANKKHLV